ncbi:MAG: hypothetical protein P8170_16420 [Gemmatimonadota bacterium]|jgi:hypothetical protein
MSRTWRARGAIGVAAAAMMAPLAGCGDGAEVGLASEPALAERPAEGVDESVWMALAGEPRFHLLAARGALEEHRLEDAASHLKAVGGVMRLEATRALGAHERQRMEGAALAIAEARRQAQEGELTPEELARVTARGLLAVAEHHRDLAVAAFRAHRPALGGIHTAETARSLKQAYAAADLDIDRVLAADLEAAEVAAERVQRDGSEAASSRADSTLVPLGHQAIRLENALGARRR